MSTPSFSGTMEAGAIVTGKCKLVTFLPTTVGTITIPTSDIRCICGDSMAGLFTHTGPQSGLVECATDSKAAPIETAGPPERASLNKHTTDTKGASIETARPTERASLNNHTTDTKGAPIETAGPTERASLNNHTTDTKRASIETARPTERASLNKHTTANGTTCQATTTKFFTDGCILSTGSAGTFNGVAFPTPKVMCLCGGNGTIMCGINTLLANGTSFIACATEQPVFTSLQTPSPLSIATTSVTQTINTSQPATCSGVRVFQMAKEPFNTTDSANKTGGGSASDAQSSGAKSKLGLGGMLATILALGCAFSMV